MPKIGEVKSAREIGMSRSHRWIWLKCIDCGKERWVHYQKQLQKRCHKCANTHNNTIIIPELRPGITMKNGYRYIKVRRDHPFISMARSDRYIAEHRLVMAKCLGRPLASNELIHHKNGDKLDNRIENLELQTFRQHSTNHTKGYSDGFSKGYLDGLETALNLAFPSGARGQSAMNVLEGRSLREVSLMDVEELKEVQMIGSKKAELIYNHFNRRNH